MYEIGFILFFVFIGGIIYAIYRMSIGDVEYYSRKTDAKNRGSNLTTGTIVIIIVVIILAILSGMQS